MKRKLIAPALVTAIIAAGLSVGNLPAQQNGTSQAQRTSTSTSTSTSLNQSTASATAVAGQVGNEPLAQSAIAAGLALGNSPFGLGAPNAAQLAKLQAEATWGLTTMRLPNYLRQAELGLSPNQGWLVTQLIPGMPAANSGIEIGSLIVELDGQPVLDNQPLPMLQAEHKLLVLGEGGVKEVRVKPLIDGLLGANPALDQLIGQGNVFAQVMPQIGAGLRGFTSAASNQPAPRSLAVSQANGEFSVSAVVDGANGPTRVELRGCRAEIIKQLSALPTDVQNQLAPHIGL